MNEAPMTSAQVRARLVEALTLDLVGPIADPSRADERLRESPSRWYLTGFLVTRDRPSRDLPRDDDDDNDDDDEAELFGSDDDPIEDPTADTIPIDDSDKAATTVTVKRAGLPSSLGLSVLVPSATKTLEVTACWGDYVPEHARGGDDDDAPDEEDRFALSSARPATKPRKRRRIRAWARVPHAETLTISLEGTFRAGPRRRAIPGSNGLVLVWMSRPAPTDALDGRLVPDGAHTVNVYLVNERQGIHGSEKDRSMAFQAELTVRCAEGFAPRPSLSGLKSGEPDDRQADLQYRDVYEYAVGHNVSARSDLDADGRCRVVRTAWIPRAEVERVEPARLEGVTLGMETLGRLAGFDEARAALVGLAEQYEAWIADQDDCRSDLHYPERVETCHDMLENARLAARRIRQGIDDLCDPKAFRAFTLANQAMGMQARRREALNRGKRDDEVGEPTWRPFQLAFLLVNLRGIIRPDDPDRQTVDLLFFPTGGGKTEAYLGLAAFTMIYRRLRVGVGGVVPRYAGVTVLMRYTLRLLTLDQLSRATALLCALELMRRRNEKELGAWPFEIGLWVGSAATPNYMGTPGDPNGVVARVLEYKIKELKRPPVPLEKCPWCGHEFSRDSFSLHPDRDNPRELSIACVADGCEFTGDRRLPIHMVDEPIYNRLPAFLIATVDKFAAMPWKGEVAKLFGKVKSYQRNAGFLGDCDEAGGIELDDPLIPPELVIQDELHLISGPLGTIAGLYETAIDHLCRDGRGRGPKLISSTATVRRAVDQIRALFGRNSVQIFPPPGPDRRDSFFARTVGDPDTARMYLGVAAQGRSAKRVLLKTYLALMSAAARFYADCGGHEAADNPADPYMTMLGYFNSLRELGGTRRLVEDEVRSRLSQYAKRRRIGEGEAESPFVDRQIGEPQELTSRYSTSQVARTREALGTPFRAESRLDVALATNMISVGLDIPRLGLMAVFAQPKMTSEYIQATSRVGRQANKPGLVVTIFNINRSRDRSHYERFRFFHDTFYRNVEATSVTPFSPRALDRALFAVTVALARLGHDFMIRNEDAEKILEHGRHLDDVARTIAERARSLSLPEAGAGPIEESPYYIKTRRLLDEWSRFADKLGRDQVRLRYEVRKSDTGRVRKLLHEMLDPGLVALTQAEQQFKAPRSMREVEPNVAVLPRRFDAPTGWIKVRNESGKSEIAISSLRQSQLVTTYGPGAMIDLPWFAAVVSGLDYWTRGTTIPEPRLEAKAQAILGGTSVALATPKPYEGNLVPETQDGVRAWRFPSWSITQETRRVEEPGREPFATRRMVREAWLDPATGLYKGLDSDKPQAVVPIRFIRACTRGHMGDIDWGYFVHGGSSKCTLTELWLDDLGATGELTDLRVRCEECGQSRLINEAAGSDNHALGLCDGSRRWLGPADESREPCTEWNRLLIRTASYAYLAQKLSVISLPDRSRKVHTAVDQHWQTTLQHVQNLGTLLAFKNLPQIAEALEGFSDDEVMAAIEEKRAGLTGPPPRKIKVAEFELLTCGQPVIGKNEHGSEFHAEEFSIAHWSGRYRRRVERVLVVHRLREVAALVGFTRFDYLSPDIDGEYDLELRTGQLGLNTNWIPAFENKGEGVFIQFNKEQVDAWKDRDEVRRLANELASGLARWCEDRGVGERTFFGAPYVMLHSLSHMLINAISLECGYPASSIKERIYANPDHGYGILLYTAAPDSYGTLGGLAHAAKRLDHYLDEALKGSQLCSNDPVCAEHRADDRNQRRYLQGSACHGCLLISETSCEMFNDFLDRGLVVPTVACRGAEFFTES